MNRPEIVAQTKTNVINAASVFTTIGISASGAFGIQALTGLRGLLALVVMLAAALALFAVTEPVIGAGTRAALKRVAKPKVSATD